MKTKYVAGYDKLNAMGIKVTAETSNSEMMANSRVAESVKKSRRRLAEVNANCIKRGDNMNGTELPSGVADILMTLL